MYKDVVLTPLQPGFLLQAVLRLIKAVERERDTRGRSAGRLPLWKGECKVSNYLLFIDKRCYPLIFSNWSVALVETCPQLLPVSSSLSQVKKCTFMYWHDLGYKFLCDFEIATKSQTKGTLI